MCAAAAKKANPLLGCIKIMRSDSITLYSTGKAGILENVKRRRIKMIWGIEIKSYDEQLRELV